MNTLLDVSYTIDAFDLLSAGNVSEEVSKLLESLHINPETIRRCTLALYEGEINMIVHANGGSVRIVVDETKTIVVTLEDNGCGIEDVQQAMKQGFTTIDKNSPLHAKNIGEGQGLSNMSKYSDYMDIDSKVNVGTTVTMVFR